jgi:outer membrane protein insertion porin family
MLISLGAFAQSEKCRDLESWRHDLKDGWILQDVSVDAGSFFTIGATHTLLDDRIDQLIDFEILARDLESLKESYRERGYFRVSLSACLQPSDGLAKHLDLFVKIILGEKAYIRDIDFHGVKSFDIAQLESVLMSQRRSVLTQLLEGLGYASIQVEEDKRRLLDFYQSRGYLDARVVDLRVNAADDLASCDLNFEIDEGKPYRVGEIKPEAWRSKLSLKKGQVFDLPTMTDDVERMLIPVKDDGFAFAKASPDLKVDGDSLSVQYEVEKGEKVLIRSILPRGLELTRPFVVTREFESARGQSYNYSDIEMRRQRLMDTGLFTSAKTSLAKTDSKGVYDLIVTVREGFPWRFNFAPYYLSGEGLILSAFLMNQNILGRGVFGLVSGQFSTLRRVFDFVLYEPWIAGKNASWLTEMHLRNLVYNSFTANTMGGGVRSYWRANTFLSIGGGLSLDDVTASAGAPLSWFTPWATMPKHLTRSAVFLGATLLPIRSVEDENASLAVDLKVTYSGPVTLSDMNFTELAAGLRWGATWKPFIFRGRLSGAVLLNSGPGLLPISERYFLGGPGTLRGYATRSVGPYVQGSGTTNLIQIGGVSKVLQSVEVEFPLIRFLDLKGYVFTDMGNTYAEGHFLDSAIGLSVGGGLLARLWRLPLKVEVSFPLVNIPGAIGFDFFAGFTSATF